MKEKGLKYNKKSFFLILGAPGYGKSFASKKEMVSVLLKDPDAEIIIIDPEREYTLMAEGLNYTILY